MSICRHEYGPCSSDSHGDATSLLSLPSTTKTKTTMTTQSSTVVRRRALDCATTVLLLVLAISSFLLCPSQALFVNHHRRVGAGPSTARSRVRRDRRHLHGKHRSFHREWLHAALRGGSIDLAEGLEGDDDASALRKEAIRRRGMSVALSSSYFAVMGAKCALPAVLSQLTSSSQGLTFTLASVQSTPQNQMARLLGLSTLSIAFGKLVLGPFIDSLGGIQSLQVALMSLMVLLLTISASQSFLVFSICWVLVDFIFSACWAACINAIHQSFPEREWGKQIGVLAAGARTGNAVAFSMFAFVLYLLENNRVQQPWRWVFFFSAALQTIPLGLLSYFGGKTVNREDSPHEIAVLPSGAKSYQLSLDILRREAKTPEFWLHMISRSCLMVFASFLLFVPTLMKSVYGCSNALASQIGSIYAIGCLLSVSFASRMFSSLPKKKKVLASCFLLLLATISSVMQLAHVSGWVTLSAGMAAFSMFLWGFAFSIPFYLPPSLYALQKGGKYGSASIADCFDFLGFTLLAVFNQYVGSIAHQLPAAWIPCFQLTTGAALVSLIAQSLAIFLQ